MIIEPDLDSYEDGVYRWTPEKSEAAWERAYRRLEQILATQRIRKVVLLIGVAGCGKSTYAKSKDESDVVTFDGMFVYPERRARVLAIAAAANVPVEAVWLDVPWDVSCQRNAARTEDRRIPDDALLRMRRDLEATPPTADEGFAALHRITPS